LFVVYNIYNVLIFLSVFSPKQAKRNPSLATKILPQKKNKKQNKTAKKEESQKWENKN
jgi:hypothetical protein